MLFRSVKVHPFHSAAFPLYYDRKRRVNWVKQPAAGRGFAVTLKESDGISYWDETGVVKQGEVIV